MGGRGDRPVDMLLEGNWRPSGTAVRPMALLDAPRVDPEENRPRGFNWKPIMAGIAAMLALLVAFAYL